MPKTKPQTKQPGYYQKPKAKTRQTKSQSERNTSLSLRSDRFVGVKIGMRGAL